MDEDQPVEDSEYVFRRIPPDFFDASLAIAVTREAFRPTKKDSSGLSVFRAGLAKPSDTLANLDQEKAKKYYVAQLPVSELRKLGLTVVPNPIPGGPPGHAIIPEISWHNYQARKDHWKPILLALAKLAIANIVHRPDSASH
jgi:hypothetical protein